VSPHLTRVTTDSNDSKSADLPATPSKRLSVPEGTIASGARALGGETWIALCAQAAVEHDPKRLLDLVSEINRLLDVRRKRLAQEALGKGSE